MTPDSDSSPKTVYFASWTGLDSRILVKNDESSVKLIKKQNKVLDTYLKYGYKEGSAQGRCLNLLLWWQCFFFIVFFYINLKLYKQKVLNSKTLLSLLLLIIYSLTMTYDINNSFWYFIYSFIKINFT